MPPDQRIGRKVLLPVLVVTSYGDLGRVHVGLGERATSSNDSASEIVTLASVAFRSKRVVVITDESQSMFVDPVSS